MSLAVAALAYRWQLGDRSGHPFAEKFRPYLTAALPLWSDVAKDINTEFRRIDKFSIRVNPLQKVVVTDNWIVMVGQWPWKFHLAHQSDVTLDLLSSEHHQISTEGQAGGTQYLTIEVKNRRPNAESFRFRLNSLEYQNLQDKLQGPIENIRNIQIFKTVSERFVEVFREEVARNPRSQSDAELEPCIGCMVSTANVVLVRRCDPESAREGEAACVNCHCRPMWCLDCLGKWCVRPRGAATWIRALLLSNILWSGSSFLASVPIHSPCKSKARSYSKAHPGIHREGKTELAFKQIFVLPLQVRLSAKPKRHRDVAELQVPLPDLSK